MSSWGSPFLDPKKHEQFYIIDRIRKKLLVDVANLAPCCHDDYDVLLEVLGTLGKCYVSNPVAKTLVWIENHDWHNCFCMSSWGSPSLDPKKLQNEQFYIMDWRRKNLLVDVANLAPCCHDDYDVLLEVLGTLGKCYVSNPFAKTLVWIENHDWHNCFCMSSWGSPLLDPKKLQNEQFYIIDWIREKTSGRCCQSGSLPWWLWCTIGGFGNPGQMLCLQSCCQNSGLDWKSWLAQLFLHVFLGLTLTGPQKASKRIILHNRLKKEKTPAGQMLC